MKTVRDLVLERWRKKRCLAKPGSGEYMDIIKIFDIRLSDNPVILEIGSLDALDAIALRKHFNFKVYAFECNRESLQLMKENLKKT